MTKIYDSFDPPADGYVTDAANLKGGFRSIAGNGPPTVTTSQLVTGMVVRTNGDGKTWSWNGTTWVEVLLIPKPAPQGEPLVILERGDGLIMLAPITGDLVQPALVLGAITSGNVPHTREVGNTVVGASFSIGYNRQPLPGFGTDGSTIPPTAKISDGIHGQAALAAPYNSFTSPFSYAASNIPASVVWTVSMSDAAISTPQTSAFTMKWAEFEYTGNFSPTRTYVPSATIYSTDFESGIDGAWTLLQPPGVPPNSGIQVVGIYQDDNLVNGTTLTPNSGSNQLFIGSIAAPWAPGQNATKAFSGNATARLAIDLSTLVQGTDFPYMTFWAAGGGRDTIAFDHFAVTVNGAPVTNILTTYINDGVYRQYAIDLYDWAGQHINVDFTNHDDGGLVDPYAVVIDDVLVQNGTWSYAAISYDQAFITGLSNSTLIPAVPYTETVPPLTYYQHTYFCVPVDLDTGSLFMEIDMAPQFRQLVASNVPVVNQWGTTVFYNIYQTNAGGFGYPTFSTTWTVTT